MHYPKKKASFHLLLHIFFFFAVSGFLYHSESGFSKGFLIKKCKTLLIPYLFWNIASTVYAMITTGDIAEALSTMLTAISKSSSVLRHLSI